MEIPAGFAQVNYQFTGIDVPSGAEITMGYDVSVFGNDAEGLGILAVESWNASDLNQFHTANSNMSNVHVKIGPNVTGPIADVENDGPGTASGASCPPQISALVRKITDAGGRAGRGRLYFPNIPESQVSGDGLLSEGWRTGLGPAWAEMMVLMAAGDASPVVLHSAGSPISTPTPITGFSGAARCATQRRRNRPT